MSFWGLFRAQWGSWVESIIGIYGRQTGEAIGGWMMQVARRVGRSPRNRVQPNGDMHEQLTKRRNPSPFLTPNTRQTFVAVCKEP